MEHKTRCHDGRHVVNLPWVIVINSTHFAKVN